MTRRFLNSLWVFALLTAPAWAAEEEAHEEGILENPETWVAVAFVFFLVALFKPIKKMLTSKIDGRTETIKSELDEAQRLREEAQHTLAEYQRKQRDADLRGRLGQRGCSPMARRAVLGHRSGLGCGSQQRAGVRQPRRNLSG